MPRGAQTPEAKKAFRAAMESAKAKKRATPDTAPATPAAINRLPRETIPAAQPVKQERTKPAKPTKPAATQQPKRDDDDDKGNSGSNSPFFF